MDDPNVPSRENLHPAHPRFQEPWGARGTSLTCALPSSNRLVGAAGCRIPAAAGPLLKPGWRRPVGAPCRQIARDRHRECVPAKLPCGFGSRRSAVPSPQSCLRGAGGPIGPPWRFEPPILQVAPWRRVVAYRASCRVFSPERWRRGSAPGGRSAQESTTSWLKHGAQTDLGTA